MIRRFVLTLLLVLAWLLLAFPIVAVLHLLLGHHGAEVFVVGMTVGSVAAIVAVLLGGRRGGRHRAPR